MTENSIIIKPDTVVHSHGVNLTSAMFNPRMVENFFKRTKFRRSKRIRTALRSSLTKIHPKSDVASTSGVESSFKKGGLQPFTSVSACDVSMISSNHKEADDDDVSTIAPSDSLESVTISTITVATTGVSSSNLYTQPPSRLKSTRPWTASGSSCSAVRSCQQLSTAGSALSDLDTNVNGSRSGQVTLGLVQSLTNEVEELKSELLASRAAILRLNEREKKLRDRLSEQAQRQLEKGTTKFEDISLGDNRPTQLIKRYGNLYTESRLEALDALDDLEEMIDCDDLKSKLLLSVVVLAFRSAQRSLEDMKQKIRDVLYIPSTLEAAASQHRLAARDVEEIVAVYLRKTIDQHDITSNYQEVSTRVWGTLFDYPSLMGCSGLLRYIKDCVRLAWALTVQNPPLVIDFESKTFDPDLHTRFHSSNPESDDITAVLWPMLTEGEGGACVYKGVVLT